MILAFWMECFLDAWRVLEDSDLLKLQKDLAMMLYVS